MDPNEVIPEAPEVDHITDQYIAWLNEEEAKLPSATLWADGALIQDSDPAFCYCEQDNLCGNCRDAADAQNLFARLRRAA